MEFVTFDKIKSTILQDIKRNSLLPILGSGFSCGCRTKNGGVVPSGKELRKHMLNELTNSKNFTTDELEDLNTRTFSMIAEVFNSPDVISDDLRRKYLTKNFFNVVLDDVAKKAFLNLDWEYIYTLNIDDAIEKNSRFRQVIYANRDIYEEIFTEAPSVIKLHGDISDIITYKDSRCEIFDVKQYTASIETNAKLLHKLKHDLEYQNIIYIGCSLDDEMDLVYSSRFAAMSSTNRYFCFVGKIDNVTKIRLGKYGITHCIEFPDYNSIYRELTELFGEAKKIQANDLDSFLHYSYKRIESDFERNSQYLFQGKSPIQRDKMILLPNYFINRPITEEIKEGLTRYVLQILYGSGCSGKSYVGIELSSLIRNKNVYYFESKTGLSYLAFMALLQKKDSILIFDENVLSLSQKELLLDNLKTIQQNGTKIVLVARNNDRDLLGMIKYKTNQGLISEAMIKRILLPNSFSSTEVYDLNSLLVKSSLGVFYESRTIVDNIISAADALSVKNRFAKIIPLFDDVRQIVCLILLAIKRKLYSNDIVLFGIEKEIIEQSKTCDPLIEQDLTKRYEISADCNSPVKYVLNAEYWLCDFLSKYVSKNKSQVIDAFKYIIHQIVAFYGKPDISFSEKDAPYKEMILFDNIVEVFKTQANLLLIKDIYESLNDDLSADPNYLHQRAKCYIRLSDLVKEVDKKKDYLEKAFRDSYTAHAVFNKRYIDSKNDKVFISSSHALYTKALCKCHLCNINNYSDIAQNDEACELLLEALKSPYNAYKRNDIFNYGDAVMRFVTTMLANPDLVNITSKNQLSMLFNYLH